MCESRFPDATLNENESPEQEASLCHYQAEGTLALPTDTFELTSPAASKRRATFIFNQIKIVLLAAARPSWQPLDAIQCRGRAKRQAAMARHYNSAMESVSYFVQGNNNNLWCGPLFFSYQLPNMAASAI